MRTIDNDLTLRLAADERDLRAAQRLRYEVFVEEMGGDGPMVDHKRRLERDAFDEVCDHLVLVDAARDPSGLDHVVGVYRLLRDDQLAPNGRFYSETEYDLAPLRQSGRSLLELGRSCLHPNYRGGGAMFQLWKGLADYVTRHGSEILFGVASFPGIDVEALAMPLAQLHLAHLAPPELRVRSRMPQRMDLMPPEKIDRRRAMVATPALIKAYLRLGGHVGWGAFIDRQFNTVDVCLVMDTERLSGRGHNLYARGSA
ncbi:GNAT family N-acetyltransferase [Roseitranquillus sediminis]|uniref:GNAT family N-acetyltransferase n=1 Tax=Roseitranquillus sediminis TaxID=2809051 RepID=UPI001D0CBBF8|nr:GNAT family N-acyltransferase [Roseitranquillus sediminis]MBM9595518.1 GNAT family N-acetyltransferase [Roseitranquillus sediminis]